MNTKSQYRDTFKGNHKKSEANKTEKGTKAKDNLHSGNGIAFSGQSNYDHDFYVIKPFAKENSFAPKN